MVETISGVTMNRAYPKAVKESIIKFKRENPRVSYVSIARDFGLSPGTVYKWIASSDIEHSWFHSDDTKQKAIKLKQDNPEMTLTAISKLCEVNLTTISKWLTKSGLHSPDFKENRTIRKKQVLAICRKNPGIRPATIAKQLDLNHGTVMEWMKEFGFYTPYEYSDKVRESAITMKLTYPCYSAARIGKELGVKGGTVLSWLSKAGLSAPVSKQ
jgi:transposase-like protein